MIDNLNSDRNKDYLSVDRLKNELFKQLSKIVKVQESAGLLYSKDDCIFCKKSSQIYNNRLLNEQEGVFSKELFYFTDIRKRDEYHFLICPRLHLSRYNILGVRDAKECARDSELEHYRSLFNLEMPKAVAYLVKKYNLKSYRLVMNHGVPYQSVDHLHLHLIGFKYTCTNNDVDDNLHK